VFRDESQNPGIATRAFNDSYRLSLTVPKTLRLKDLTSVKVIYEPIPSASPVDQVDESRNSEINAALIKEPDSNYGVYVNTQLELDGMQVIPSDVISQPMIRGKDLAYDWQITAISAGINSGTLWLSLRVVPFEGGESITRTLSAQKVEIQVTDFWGMDGQTARLAGCFGLGLALVFFITDLLRAGYHMRVKIGDTQVK
jgi:hypothetical protein